MVLVLVHDDASGAGDVVLVGLDDDARATDRTVVARPDLPAAVAAREQERPRWVWDDTARRYPPLLAAGVRVERAHDLRLCRTILRRSVRTAGSALATAPPGPWDVTGRERWAGGGGTAGGGAGGTAGTPPGVTAGPSSAAATLFDEPADAGPTDADAVEELRAQLAAVAGADEPGRLRLLLAAESTGALIAAEMRHDGLPWDVATHEALLAEQLGPRPPEGVRPARLEELAEQVRAALDRPGLNPDSQPDLLGALRSAGLPVTTTSKHALGGIDHPVVAPLLEYKRLARLAGANGWAWMDQWVRDGRFRPEYVPAGVVTGRWASHGGGALQLPAGVRGAVRADPGWCLVVADAAQLEPRILAAMSGDGAMAEAGRQADLYAGLVAARVVATRQDAKVAMLGAIYGATSGAAGALVPRLRRAYPQAVALVEEAARAGERGGVVSTWLGRSSPPPSAEHLADLRAVTQEGAAAAEVERVRRRARDHGRFTRNFVVQGTAAEWALCWLASLRRRLLALDRRPHLVLFLHDEVVVHSPADVAAAVVVEVQAAAEEAGRLLFGPTRVEFPLDVAVVGSYDQAS